jgi:hypothetical protein
MPHELGASGNRNGLIAFEPRLKTARRVARSSMDFHFSSYKPVTALAPSRAWDPQFLDLKI